jgi:hypothetical protein
MLRNAIIALAIVLALGSSAFASGGGYSGEGFRGSHFGGGFGGTPGNHGGYDNRASRYGSRDMWGHWGAYYGPMIPTI